MLMDPQDPANKEGRAKAVKGYQIFAIGFVVFGVGMLVCGVVAAVHADVDEMRGPPYFIGGFTVGVFTLVMALICFYIYKKVSNTSVDGNLKSLRCGMVGHYIFSSFMIFACFIGVYMAGLGGFAFGRDEMTELNKALSAVILAGCALGIVASIASLCLVCIYGKYFGVNFSGRRGRMMIVNPNNTIGAYPSGQGNNTQVHQLQLQNQILQQQLQQQRQLNQQQQYSGGGLTQPSMFAPTSYSSFK